MPNSRHYFSRTANASSGTSAWVIQDTRLSLRPWYRAPCWAATTSQEFHHCSIAAAATPSATSSWPSSYLIVSDSTLLICPFSPPLPWHLADHYRTAHDTHSTVRRLILPYGQASIESRIIVAILPRVGLAPGTALMSRPHVEGFSSPFPHCWASHFRFLQSARKPHKHRLY